MRTELEWHGEKVARSERRGAAKGLHLASEHVLTVSNTRVPHESGTLERSGSTDVDEHALRASVYYDTPYAVYQHEDMTLAHDDGRQAKYLESTLTEEPATVGQIIAASIRDALEG